MKKKATHGFHSTGLHIHCRRDKNKIDCPVTSVLHFHTVYILKFMREWCIYNSECLCPWYENIYIYIWRRKGGDLVNSPKIFSILRKRTISAEPKHRGLCTYEVSLTTSLVSFTLDAVTESSEINFTACDAKNVGRIWRKVLPFFNVFECLKQNTLLAIYYLISKLKTMWILVTCTCAGLVACHLLLMNIKGSKIAFWKFVYKTEVFINKNRTIKHFKSISLEEKNNQA